MGDSFRIGTHGFSALEQGLLAQQLGILQGRTTAPWSYVGERQREAHLTLVMSESLPPEEIIAPITGLIASNRATPELANALSFEWPIKLLSLSDLLTRAEAHFQNEIAKAAPTRAIERIAAITGAAMIKNASLLIFIDAANDMLLANVPRMQDVIDTLTHGNFSIKTVESSRAVDSTWMVRASLRAVLWNQALEQGPPVDEPWDDANIAYRIGQWPRFGQWDAAPELIRLASFYSCQHATVMQGCEFARSDRSTVRSFLYACKLVGLQLSCEHLPPARFRRGPQAAPPTSAAPARQDAGWLARLKLRLGISTPESA
jgi:hypothetical protein